MSKKRKQKLQHYFALMRLNKPIGTYLVLWPTLWALWLAAEGTPRLDILIIFILGVVLMRSAGCVINDFADRNIDGHVQRTKSRPLITGEVSKKEALGLFLVLITLAFILVLFTNSLTIKLSLGALFLAAVYPFMKRYTHIPQVVLGAAFAWSVPMAFAAQKGEIVAPLWVLYTAVVLWTVAYDTFYAMVDREDDLKIGVKSTAILFGEMDRMMTASLQIMALIALAMVGQRFALGSYYYGGLALAACLFLYQQWLIKDRDPKRCFQAFLNNNWVGMLIFGGIVVDYALKSA